MSVSWWNNVIIITLLALLLLLKVGKYFKTFACYKVPYRLAKKLSGFIDRKERTFSNSHVKISDVLTFNQPFIFLDGEGHCDGRAYFTNKAQQPDQ